MIWGRKTCTVRHSWEQLWLEPPSPVTTTCQRSQQSRCTYYLRFEKMLERWWKSLTMTGMVERSAATALPARSRTARSFPSLRPATAHDKPCSTAALWHSLKTQTSFVPKISYSKMYCDTCGRTQQRIVLWILRLRRWLNRNGSSWQPPLLSSQDLRDCVSWLSTSLTRSDRPGPRLEDWVGYLDCLLYAVTLWAHAQVKCYWKDFLECQINEFQVSNNAWKSFVPTLKAWC